MCRLMIDTNILLDTLDSQRPESEEALELLSRCNGCGELGMVSSHSLQDVYYVSRKMHGERWARDAIGHLMGLVTIAPVDDEVCDHAMRSDEPDFEDGVVRACAELNGAGYIVTRDSGAFANCKIRSVTASEYLRIADTNGREAPVA